MFLRGPSGSGLIAPRSAGACMVAAGTVGMAGELPGEPVPVLQQHQGHPVLPTSSARQAAMWSPGRLDWRQCLVCVCPGGECCGSCEEAWVPPGTMSEVPEDAPCAASRGHLSLCLSQITIFGPSSQAATSLGAHPGNWGAVQTQASGSPASPGRPSAAQPESLWGAYPMVKGHLLWPLQNFLSWGRPLPQQAPFLCSVPVSTQNKL